MKRGGVSILWTPLINDANDVRKKVMDSQAGKKCLVKPNQTEYGSAFCLIPKPLLKDYKY